MKYSMVEVTKEVADKIVWPAKYQRKPSHSKVVGIRAAVNEGLIIPPILVCQIGRELQITDGQHRLDAWREQPYPLYALVVETDEKTAILSFLKANRSATKMSAKHAYTVSPARTSVKMREIADKHGVEVDDAAKVILGLTKKTILSHDEELNGAIDKANKIMRVWTRDRRWDKRIGTYAERGTLHALGRVCAGKKRIREAVRVIQSLDFGAGSSISRLKGTQFNNISALSDLFNSKLAESKF